jgi:hypothetical protein
MGVQVGTHGPTKEKVSSDHDAFASFIYRCLNVHPIHPMFFAEASCCAWLRTSLISSLLNCSNAIGDSILQCRTFRLVDLPQNLYQSLFEGVMVPVHCIPMFAPTFLVYTSCSSSRVRAFLVVHLQTIPHEASSRSDGQPEVDWILAMSISSSSMVKSASEGPTGTCSSCTCPSFSSSASSFDSYPRSFGNPSGICSNSCRSCRGRGGRC